MGVWVKKKNKTSPTLHGETDGERKGGWEEQAERGYGTESTAVLFACSETQQKTHTNKLSFFHTSSGKNRRIHKKGITAAYRPVRWPSLNCGASKAQPNVSHCLQKQNPIDISELWGRTLLLGNSIPQPTVFPNPLTSVQPYAPLPPFTNPLSLQILYPSAILLLSLKALLFPNASWTHQHGISQCLSSNLHILSPIIECHVHPPLITTVMKLSDYSQITWPSLLEVDIILSLLQ